MDTQKKPGKLQDLPGMLGNLVEDLYTLILVHHVHLLSMVLGIIIGISLQTFGTMHRSLQ
jgi:hypothetical protein